MKAIMPTLTVLALLVGISGCFLPVRDRDQRDWRDDRRGVQYGAGGRDHSGRDCWSNGQQHCRDDD